MSLELRKKRGSAVKKTILAVEDEKDIVELLEYSLGREGFEVRCAESGGEALAFVRCNSPDLILLDLMLPDIDGLEICRLLKADADTSHIPIIMLTAKSDDADIVAGLELGADDYITKPFSMKVLVARVRALLRRRRRIENGDVRQLKEVVISRAKRLVRVNNLPVELTAHEFELLLFLTSRPGWVFTRSQIISAVRGEGYAITDRAIDVQIMGLRRKLGMAGKYVETVRGVGYRFREDS
jgi:two-component system phosphate regulon response regulator PhoB